MYKRSFDYIANCLRGYPASHSLNDWENCENAIRWRRKNLVKYRVSPINTINWLKLANALTFAFRLWKNWPVPIKSAFTSFCHPQFQKRVFLLLLMTNRNGKELWSGKTNNCGFVGILNPRPRTTPRSLPIQKKSEIRHPDEFDRQNLRLKAFFPIGRRSFAEVSLLTV